MALELYLIRHAEPEWVVDDKNIVDPGLTERGHRQARALADALDGVHFDEIWCSPLRRPQLTAAPLLERRDLGVQIAPWLEEIREPNWHGLPATLAADAYAEDRNQSAEERWNGLPGGEPPRDFAARVVLGCASFLHDRHVTRTEQLLPVWEMPDEPRRVALFAHAGTNGMVLCHVLGIPPVPWEWDRLSTGHASITRIEPMKVGGGYTYMLSALSDQEHLARPDRTR